MDLLIHIAILIVASIVIFYTGEIFAGASSKIGDYFHLSKSVKGATLDAVASSMPELMVALFSVVFFKEFAVGIGTITGSALFNLLVIPGICVLVCPKVFKVSHEVVHRDALFYILSVFVLLCCTIYAQVWGLTVAIILLAGYYAYVHTIVTSTKEHRAKNEKTSEDISITKQLGIAIGMMGVMGVATYFLTESSIELAHLLNVPAVIVAFTITAAATSVPDTVISVVNAKKGDVDDATSNVFGSNIFDIFVALGLPLLIYSLMKGAVEIEFDHLEFVLGLLGSTILVLFFFSQKYTLSKLQGKLMLLIYLGFLGYTVYLGIS